MELTGKVEKLDQNVERINAVVTDADRRLVRLETIIEVTRTDGATLRIAGDSDEHAHKDRSHVPQYQTAVQF